MLVGISGMLSVENDFGRQSCRVRSDSEMADCQSCTSTSSSDSDDLLYPFASSEARRLYWAGRLHVSINLLASHRSQLDLLSSAPYPSVRHRSRSLFNILAEPRPLRDSNKESSNGSSFFIDPERLAQLGRQTKVINRAKSRTGVTVQFPSASHLFVPLELVSRTARSLSICCCNEARLSCPG